MTLKQPKPPTDETAAADMLVAEARRAVHESLTFLAAPEADRVRALIADLETAVEGRTAIRGAIYPHADGDLTVLGPEVFVSADGQVICWRGMNYDRRPTAGADS